MTIDPTASQSPFRVITVATMIGSHQQILVDCQARKYLPPLGHQHQSAFNSVDGRTTANFDALEQKRSRILPLQACEGS